MNLSRRFGKLFEIWAANWLCIKGFDLVERNYHTRNGEIDVIARYKGSYCFFEVRFRHNSSLSFNEQFLTSYKYYKFFRTVSSYISQKNVRNIKGLFLFAISFNPQSYKFIEKVVQLEV